MPDQNCQCPQADYRSHERNPAPDFLFQETRRLAVLTDVGYSGANRAVFTFNPVNSSTRPLMSTCFMSGTFRLLLDRSSVILNWPDSADLYLIAELPPMIPRGAEGIKAMVGTAVIDLRPACL